MTMGNCTRRPALCPSVVANEVCGCDHYTYFDPCLAAANGVNIAAEGVCGEEMHVHCISVSDCPDPLPKGATCVNFEYSCNAEPEPECWVLPDSCPNSEPGALRECSGGNDQCSGVCEAAKSDKLFVWDDVCN